MGPKLGLCCIALDVDLKFRTMTVKKFQSLDKSQALKELGEICVHNISVVAQNIKYCAVAGFAHYRIPSSIFPVLSYFKISWTDLPNGHEISSNLSQIGPLAMRLGISLSMHPDQFVSLGSPNETTRKNSIYEFIFQGSILDAMRVSSGAKTPMCLHVSNGSKNPQDTYDLFMKSVLEMPEHIVERLVLENEDKGCWNAETLFKTFGAKFPLVFDNHHDSLNPSSQNRDWCKVFLSTWPAGIMPVFHWSEGMEEDQRSHADYFSRLPDCVKFGTGIIWECEVKAKDRAIKKALRDFFS